MPTVFLSPIGNDAPFVDSNGDPLNGGLLYTHTAGSSTPETTYTTSTGNVANANPIELLPSGYPGSNGNVLEIWLTSGVSYKFTLKTAAGVTLWTRDNISGVNDATSSSSQWETGPAPTYISATSFSLAGDQTSTFTVGRRLKTTNSGGTIYSTILSSAFGAVTTVVVQNDSGTLDSGLSAVSYGLISVQNTSEPAIGTEYVCQGRLTLTSALPVTTADVTAAETVYFTPFRGNKIDLYDSTISAWVRVTFAELTLDVPDATQMNDVFIYLASGVLTLEAVAWTNTTTRATALTTQNGVLVKSGAVGRRYLGSFYATTAGNGQTEDSTGKRYLWNYYNRVMRSARNAIETADSWNYTTATWRQANANASNQFEYVQGVSEDALIASVQASYQNSTGAVSAGVGIGIDSTSVDSSIQKTPGLAPQTRMITTAYYEGYPGVGYHTVVWLERSEATGTTGWAGDNGAPIYTQSGIMGRLPA